MTMLPNVEALLWGIGVGCVCLSVAAYCFGYVRGFHAGLDDHTGWQDEALWWRRNATGIEKREGSDAPD